MYFKEYLYNVTNEDKRNVNKVVVVFVEAVAIIMLTPGAHYLERATSLYSCQGIFANWFIFRTILALKRPTNQ